MGRQSAQVTGNCKPVDVNLVLPTYHRRQSPAQWRIGVASRAVDLLGRTRVGRRQRHVWNLPQAAALSLPPAVQQDALASGAASTCPAHPGDSLYMLRFKAQSLTGAPVRATVRVARNGGDWSSLGLERWVTVPADSRDSSQRACSLQQPTHQGRLSYLCTQVINLAHP
jgi:hypothetical protein